jgi:hypothetical protein
MYHVGGVVLESIEFLGNPRKTTSDQCKDREHRQDLNLQGWKGTRP